MERLKFFRNFAEGWRKSSFRKILLEDLPREKKIPEHCSPIPQSGAVSRRFCTEFRFYQKKRIVFFKLYLSVNLDKINLMN